MFDFVYTQTIFSFLFDWTWFLEHFFPPHPLEHIHLMSVFVQKREYSWRRQSKPLANKSIWILGEKTFECQFYPCETIGFCRELLNWLSIDWKVTQWFIVWVTCKLSVFFVRDINRSKCIFVFKPESRRKKEKSLLFFFWNHTQQTVWIPEKRQFCGKEKTVTIDTKTILMKRKSI